MAKTGGTSIAKALRPELHLDERGDIIYPGKHWWISKYEIEHPIECRDYFKFTIARNPWDRIVSLFTMWQKLGKANDFKRFVLRN